jgi:hypothetical protein
MYVNCELYLCWSFMSKSEILTLYVWNFILKLYVETVTVRPVTFPTCEMRFQLQSTISTKLSVPHSFTTLNSKE